MLYFQLPDSVPEATNEHALVQYAIDPSLLAQAKDAASPNAKSVWEQWDGDYNVLLQIDVPDEKVKALVTWGDKGLLALYCLTHYLIEERGLEGLLLKQKFVQLFTAMDKVYVLFDSFCISQFIQIDPNYLYWCISSNSITTL